MLVPAEVELLVVGCHFSGKKAFVGKLLQTEEGFQSGGWVNKLSVVGRGGGKEPVFI